MFAVLLFSGRLHQLLQSFVITKELKENDSVKIQQNDYFVVACVINSTDCCSMCVNWWLC